MGQGRASGKCCIQTSLESSQWVPKGLCESNPCWSITSMLCPSSVRWLGSPARQVTSTALPVAHHNKWWSLPRPSDVAWPAMWEVLLWHLPMLGEMLCMGQMHSLIQSNQCHMLQLMETPPDVFRKKLSGASAPPSNYSAAGCRTLPRAGATFCCHSAGPAEVCEHCNVVHIYYAHLYKY